MYFLQLHFRHDKRQISSKHILVNEESSKLINYKIVFTYSVYSEAQIAAPCAASEVVILKKKGTTSF
jgi:hypothetical protein